MVRQGRSTQFSFTLNNYDDLDCDRLLAGNRTVRYLIFGKECGDSGTRHLQGFVQFKNRCTFSDAKAFLSDRVFIEVTRSPKKSIEYCKKEGDYYEFGELSNPGKRSDLDAFKEFVKLGNYDLKVLREQHSMVLAKYPRFVQEYLSDSIPRAEFEVFPLRDWQATLYTKLRLNPIDREIMFLVDHTGNTGKSWFARYVHKLLQSVQIMIPGKKADMTYALLETNKILFLDCPRSKQGEFIQYDFLEEVKNGLVFSSKYESRMKYLCPCHVVVMMNEDPDPTKLSSDRYNIIRL